MTTTEYYQKLQMLLDSKGKLQDFIKLYEEKWEIPPNDTLIEQYKQRLTGGVVDETQEIEEDEEYEEDYDEDSDDYDGEEEF